MIRSVRYFVHIVCYFNLALEFRTTPKYEGPQPRNVAQNFMAVDIIVLRKLYVTGRQTDSS